MVGDEQQGALRRRLCSICRSDEDAANDTRGGTLINKAFVTSLAVPVSPKCSLTLTFRQPAARHMKLVEIDLHHHRAGPHRPAFSVVVLTQYAKAKPPRFPGWLLLLQRSQCTRYIVRLVYTKGRGDIFGNRKAPRGAYCPTGHYKQLIHGKTHARDFQIRGLR